MSNEQWSSAHNAGVVGVSSMLQAAKRNTDKPVSVQAHKPRFMQKTEKMTIFNKSWSFIKEIYRNTNKYTTTEGVDEFRLWGVCEYCCFESV